MYDLYIHREYYDNIRVRFNDKFYLINDTIEKVQYYSIKIDNYVYTILPNRYVSNNLTAYRSKREEEFDAIVITDLDTKNSMLIERPFIDKVEPAVQLSTQTYDTFTNNDEMYKPLNMGKEQIELFNSISDSNREKNIFSFIYKYANIQIDNSEEYEYNTVTYDEKSEEATLHLVDTKRENREKALNEFIKQIKIVNNRIIELLSFDTTFKSVENELKRYIELFNLVLFRNNDTRDIYYSVYENDVKDWYLYDMLNMYFSIYRDRKIKDFTNDIKHSIEESSIKTFHDTLAETYNAIKRELAEEEYAEVLKTYTYKSYVGENFSIIAPPTLIAIINEGEVLKHCVSSYINRILKKETFIFFLRANDDLDTPLVTIEVRNNEILQASGMYNRRLKSDSEEMKTILEFAKLNGIKVNTYYVCI